MEGLRAGIIDNTLKNNPITKSLYQGIFPSDKLSKHVCKKLPCAIVVNFDTKNEPGSHWIAILIDKNKNVEYFDSYARSISFNHRVFDYVTSITKNGHIKHLSGRAIQQNKTSVCGHYTILFILCRAKKISFEKFSDTFSDQRYAGEYDSTIKSIIDQVINESSNINKTRCNALLRSTCVCNPQQTCTKKHDCIEKHRVGLLRKDRCYTLS